MGKSQYSIKFGGLPMGEHQFEFEINDSFFEQFTESEIRKANIKVTATLIKQNNLLQLLFDFYGTVGATCDRCLIECDYEISGSEKLIIKHGDPEESNDDMLVLREGLEIIEFANYLYEYIIVSVPTRIVPCEDLDDFEGECDEETLAKFNETKVDTEPNQEWDKLKNIKFNNN